MTKIKFLFFLVSAVVTLSPQTFAKLQKISSKNQKSNLFIDLKQFGVLSPTQREDYIRLMQKTFFELENSMARQIEFSSLINLIVNQKAYASSNKLCLIGGQSRNVTSGKCPTTGLSCEGKEDSFKCGDLFGSACIDRKPISTISLRCYQNSKPGDVTPANFVRVANGINEIFSSICINNNKSKSCEFAQKRFKEISDYNSKLATDLLRRTEEPETQKTVDEARISSNKTKPIELVGNKCVPENFAKKECVENSYSVISCDNPTVDKAMKCSGHALIYCSNGKNGFQKQIVGKKIKDFLFNETNKEILTLFLKKEKLEEDVLKYYSDTDYFSYSDSDLDFVTNIAKELNIQNGLCEKIANLDKKNGPMSACNKKKDNELRKVNIEFKELYEETSKKDVNLMSEITKCEMRGTSSLKMHQLEEGNPNEKTFMIITKIDSTRSAVDIEFIDEWGHLTKKSVRTTSWGPQSKIFEVDPCRLRESDSYDKSHSESNNICMLLKKYNSNLKLKPTFPLVPIDAAVTR